MNLTNYTIRDILYIRSTDPDSETIVFKKHLIKELRENYKLEFRQIGFLLQENYLNLKSLYYQCFQDGFYEH